MDRIDRDSKRMTTHLKQVVQSFEKCIKSEGSPEAEGDLGFELAEFKDLARGELQLLRGQIRKGFSKAQAVTTSMGHLDRVCLPQFSGTVTDFFGFRTMFTALTETAEYPSTVLMAQLRGCLFRESLKLVEGHTEV